mmetsp:Transcript_10275/g.38157  ORF Transcript_10275/g.38157 Transcript_10275/m.38157 type:complete len:186 (+) Transcript_10275:137-694(+)
MSHLPGTQSNLIFTPNLTALTTTIFSQYSSHSQKSSLSQADFRNVCESLELYLSNERFRALWQKLVGRGKEMSVAQFRAFLVFHNDDCLENEELKRVFEVLDVNRDGKVDWRDLEKSWNGIGEHSGMAGSDSHTKSRAEIQSIMKSMEGITTSCKGRVALDFDAFCCVMKGSVPKQEETLVEGEQ